MGRQCSSSVVLKPLSKQSFVRSRIFYWSFKRVCCLDSTFTTLLVLVHQNFGILSEKNYAHNRFTVQCYRQEVYNHKRQQRYASSVFDITCSFERMWCLHRIGENIQSSGLAKGTCVCQQIRWIGMSVSNEGDRRYGGTEVTQKLSLHVLKVQQTTWRYAQPQHWAQKAELLRNFVQFGLSCPLLPFRPSAVLCKIHSWHSHPARLTLAQLARVLSHLRPLRFRRRCALRSYRADPRRRQCLTPQTCLAA